MRVSRPGFGLSRFPALAAACVLGAALAVIVPSSTQTAIANGDTRVINLHHAHTQETISIAFRVNGSYDFAALQKLNWFLRDWRNDATIKMDPRLFDVIWEAQRGAGSSMPVRVQSAYRSPATNSMLRRRSRGVAEFSQHMQGRAMDIHVSDVSMARIRETAMRMQRGGVGYYPASNFVHLDVGSVRAWPRMSYDQLARLFPDGKTVHLPTNGQPLARYEDARIELASRGGSYAPSLAQVQSKGFFASLFGWGDEEDEGSAPATRGRGRTAPAQTAAYAPAASDDGSSASFFRADADRSPVVVAQARRQIAAPVAAPVMAPVTAPVTAPVLAPVAAPAPVLTATFAPSRPGFDAPLPPRRPAEASAPVLVAPVLVAAAAPSVPMPPSRPSEFMVSYDDKTASIPPASIPKPPVRTAALPAPGLPPLITEGSQSAGVQAPGMMAYAAVSPELTAVARSPRQARAAAQADAKRANQGRKITLTAARLDRSNYAVLTAAQSIASAPPASAMGATVAPLRSAARAEASYLMFAPPLAAPVLMGSLEARR